MERSTGLCFNAVSRKKFRNNSSKYSISKNNPYQVPPNEEGVLGNFAEVLAAITPGTTIAQGQNW